MRYEFCELSRWVSVWEGIPAGRQLGWDMEETQVHDTVTYLQVNIHGSDSLLDLVRPRSFYGSAGRAHHAYTCRAGGLRRGAAQNVYSGLTNVAMTFCGSRTKVWTKPPTVGSECSSGCGWWCSSIFMKGSCRSTFGSIVRKVFCLALGRRILVDGMEVSDWTG